MPEDDKSLVDKMLEELGGAPTDDYQDAPSPEPKLPEVAPVSPIPDALFEKPTPSDDADIDEIVGGNEKEGLKNLRNAYKDLKNQWQQAQAKMQELELTANQKRAGSEEVEKMRSQLESMSDELERVALERHPKFQQQFKARGDALSKMLTDIEVEGMTQDQVAEIVRNPTREAMNELAERVTPFEYSNIMNVATRFRELNAEKQAALDNHREALTALEQQEATQKERIKVQQVQQFDQTIDNEGKAFEFMREMEGNGEWNNSVRAMREQARHLFFDESNSKNLMRASMLAVMAEPYRNAYISTRTQLKEALAQIDAMKASNPSVPFDGDRGGGRTPTPAEDEDFGSFVNRQVAGAH